MRYYELTISDPKSGLVWKPSRTGLGFVKEAGGATFSSWVQGPLGMQTDRGALNIEFDAPIYSFNQSQGRQWIRIYGIGLPMIGQAANLNGANFQLSAGMKPGLPLATAAASQAGVILQGTVFQAFGNWQGTLQTLELVVNPSADSVRNIGFNWPSGSNLSQAILLSIAQAFSPPNSLTKYAPNINIGSNLKKADTQGGIYPNIYTFSSYLNEISKQVGTPVYGDNYPGVMLTITGNTINVYDGHGETPAKVINIAFQDLVGQPTWINPSQVSFKTVLRSDIACGMVVQFPQGLNAPFVLTSAAAATGTLNAPASDTTSFQGKFFITEVHHWANFRQADGDSWNTTYLATAPPSFASTTAAAVATGFG